MLVSCVDFGKSLVIVDAAHARRLQTLCTSDDNEGGIAQNIVMSSRHDCTARAAMGSHALGKAKLVVPDSRTGRFCSCFSY